MFPRIDAKRIYAVLEAALESSGSGEDSQSATEVTQLEPAVTAAEFARLDIRVATVLEAEMVKDTDKLLRLVLDLGFETRQVLAGIGNVYEPSALVGSQVAVIANLKPRRIRGLRSEGMILAASVGSGDGSVLVGFNGDVPNGARVR